MSLCSRSNTPLGAGQSLNRSGRGSCKKKYWPCSQLKVVVSSLQGLEVRGIPQDKFLLTNKSGDQAEVGLLGEADGERVPFLFHKFLCMSVVDESEQQDGELDCSHSALRSPGECRANIDSARLINPVSILISSVSCVEERDFFISPS